MPRYALPVAVAIAIIVATAVLEGRWSERWTKLPPSPELQEFSERIKNIPMSFDEWESTEEPVPKEEIEAARAAGYCSRTYRSRLDSRKQVSIYISTGPSFAMTQHTPEKCYPAAGYEQQNGDTPKIFVEYDKTAGEFYTDKFRKGEPGKDFQNKRIFWSFSVDGNWVASDKWRLNSYPALVKIYAITEVPATSEGKAEDSEAIQFLRKFMPLVNATMFPPDKKESNSDADKPATDTGTQPPAEKSTAPAANGTATGATALPTKSPEPAAAK